jgi:hypothetical protein
MVCILLPETILLIRLGQIPVMAAKSDTAAETNKSQFTFAKPLRAIPAQSIQLIKAKNIRIETEVFIITFLLFVIGIALPGLDNWDSKFASGGKVIL